MGLFSKKPEEGAVPERIERIAWNPKYSVHVELLDAQHRELFSIMNRISDLYEKGSQDLLPVLRDLVQYAMDHFHAENLVMMKAAYPGIASHSKEHDQFVETVQGFLSDYRKQGDQLTYRMLIYVRDWLLTHTQKIDMNYADFLIRTEAFDKEVPYNLKNVMDVMKMMATTEQLVADFYRTCAEIWEEDRTFWLAIVAEEEKHAENIARMAQIVAARPERFEIGRPFNLAAIRTIMTGVEGHLKRLKEGRIPLDRLMFVARDIEASVIEKYYSEIVRTTDVEYLNLVKEITKESTGHKEIIEQRIRALKERGIS